MYPLIAENDTLILREEYVKMSDGVRLYTRIAIPKGKEKHPIVLIRTPYEKERNGIPYDISLFDKYNYIKSGYAVIVQHCRGTGDSEGEFHPYVEREDGLETLDFIRALPFYCGEIFLWGRSYLTTVHLCYLTAKPHDIKGAAFEIQTDRMFERNFRNGCCFNLCMVDWWLNRLRRRFPEQNRDEIRKLPYKDIMKRVIGKDLPEYSNHLLHNKEDDFWRSDPRYSVIDSIDFPVLFTDGWYDYYTHGMFSMWSRLPEETKKKSAFVVGPWGHDTKVKEGTEYSLPNGNIPSDYAVRWFNSIREGKKYELAEYGKVNYYSVGADEWKIAEFPQKAKGTKKLYFAENGKLLEDSSAGSITYEYDPEKPNNAYKYLNIYKAEKINSIDGICSFVSEPFENDESFFGNIGWHMTVSSDCEESAFFIRVFLEKTVKHII